MLDKWQTSIGIVLVLVGLGLTAGQGFELTPLVILFWALAVIVTLVTYLHRPDEARDGDHSERETRRKARELVGRALEELSACELLAYRGRDSRDYDSVLAKLDAIEARIRHVSENYLDGSLLSRYQAVNVHDTPLDEATKAYFISRAQGSFWTVYQQIKGWRRLLAEVMSELSR